MADACPSGLAPLKLCEGAVRRVHDKATRSCNMSRMRTKNTKPEMLVQHIGLPDTKPSLKEKWLENNSYIGMSIETGKLNRTQNYLKKLPADAATTHTRY